MKHHFLNIAVGAVVAVSAPIDARAVYLNPHGNGQALIYPYYTAQSNGTNPLNTYVSVVNTSPTAKVIRVRFREGRKSREVAGFNLYLAGSDTWAGAVVPTESGARLITVDKSCVNAAFLSDGPVKYLEFSNARYSGMNSDGLGEGPDRVREGYVEMIEMASLIGASADNVNPPRANNSATAPANCAAVQGTSVVLETAGPSGGLSGTLTLINVASGMDFTVKADALADLASQPFYRDYSDPYPDFNAAEVKPVSHFLAGGKSYRAAWSNGVDAVSSALMKVSVWNEVVLDAGTNSHTDWIVTLPMRRFYESSVPNTPTTYPAPAGAGDPFTVFWRPRDGNGATLVNTCGFPCPFNTFEVNPRAPWAATVLSFSRSVRPAIDALTASTVLGSSNAVMITLPTSAENGAASLDLGFIRPRLTFQGTSLRISDGVASLESGSLLGAPAVGFMVRTFQNGLLRCGVDTCQGNYGGSFSHTSQPPEVRPLQ
jgi:hypothetical protein